MMIQQIFLTALIAALILLVEHWFPWRLVFRRELPRVAAYVMGNLAMICPLSVLYWAWSGQSFVWPAMHLVALWVVSGAGGLAVGFAYAIDWILLRLALASDLAELHDQVRVFRDWADQ